MDFNCDSIKSYFISNFIEKSNFETFFSILINSITNLSEINKESFFYLFNEIPLIIKENLFMLISDKNNSCILNKIDLINSFKNIFFNDLNFKMNFFLDFFTSTNNENLIFSFDVKIIFYHFHYHYTNKSSEFIDNIIDNIFNKKEYLNKTEFEKYLININSDLFYLFYYYFNTKFFDINDLIFFQNFYKNINNSSSLSTNKISNKNDFKTIKEPSNNLINYFEIVNTKIDDLEYQINFNQNKRKESMETNTSEEENNNLNNMKINYKYKITDLNISSENFCNDNKIISCDLYFLNNYFIITNFKEKLFRIYPIQKSFIKNINNKKEKKIFLTEVNNQIFNYFINNNKINNNYSKIIIYFSNQNLRKEFFENFISFQKNNNFKHKYLLLDKIGKGSYASIYSAKNKITQKEFAVKIIRKNEKLNITEIEIYYILQNISHKNIIKIYDIFEDNENYYIILEHCIEDLNSLKVINEKYSKKFYYIKEIIEGINFLHSLGIMHRDLKLSNVLINEKDQLKIIDFGESICFFKNSELSEIFGSYGFFPPEMILNQKYNKNAEFWNIGLISFYLIFKYLPFDNDVNEDKLNKFEIKKYLQENKQNIFKLKKLKENNNEEKYLNYIKNIAITLLNKDIKLRGKEINQIFDNEKN